MLRRVVLPAAGVALLATGCNPHMYGALGTQVAEFYFSGSSTAAIRAHALHACSGLPGTQAYPLPKAGAPAASVVYDVRFNVTHASNMQLQRLLTCMSRQRDVTGYDIPDDDD